MSMRHIFGFDHIPLGLVDVASYFDTRLKFFVGEGSVQAGTIVAGGWITGGGGGAFEALVPQVINDTPTHVVFGFRARQGNAAALGSNTPLALYLGGAFTTFFTQAEMVASKLGTATGEYVTLDVNLTSGVVRRWLGSLELPALTNIPLNTLKTGSYLFYIQAYNGTYAAYQYRDIYIGDNFDGIDVNVLGDRVVNSLPVKAAVGANWAASDAGSLVTALNKAWVTGAIDVTALNQTDNGAIRVQFNQQGVTTDIDAVQIEAAGSVGSPTTGIKIAREGDATGKTFAPGSAVKWGARSPIYQTKSDGSKITSVDFASMNFDISGV